MAANKRVSPTRKSTKAKNVEVDNNLLTIDDLIAEDHLYDELVKAEFPNGKYTFVRKKFRPSEVDDMLQDFGNYINEYAIKIGEPTEEKARDHLHLFILLKFSKMSPDYPESFDAKVYKFEKILESRLADKVFSYFDTEEIAYIYDRMTEKFNVHLDIINKNKEVRDKVVDHVKKSDMPFKDAILNVIFKENIIDETGDEESVETV